MAWYNDARQPYGKPRPPQNKSECGGHKNEFLVFILVREKDFRKITPICIISYEKPQALLLLICA